MEVTARRALADKIFEEMQEQLSYLYRRWQSEREYEDFNEYKALVTKTLTERYSVCNISLTKKPFAVSYTLAGCRYRITVKAREYSYMRVVHDMIP